MRVYLDRGAGPTYLGLYTMIEIPDEPMLDTCSVRVPAISISLTALADAGPSSTRTTFPSERMTPTRTGPTSRTRSPR